MTASASGDEKSLGPQSIRIDLDGAQLLELRPLAHDVDIQNPNSPLARQLGALLQHLPMAQLAVRQMTSTTYEMVLSPELAAGLGTTFSMMKSKAVEGAIRGSVMGPAGAVGQASFLPVAAGPAVVAMAWQVAAVVTQQKYLADIHRELSSVNARLEGLLDQFKAERRARLTTGLRFFRQEVPRLLAGEPTAEISAVIAAEVIRQAIVADEIMDTEREATLSALNALRVVVASNDGVDAKKDEGLRAIREAREATRRYFAAAQVLGAGLQSRGALAGELSHSMTLTAMLRERVGGFRDEVLRLYDDHHASIDNLEAPLSREKTRAEARMTLRGALTGFRDSTRDDCIAVHGTLQRVSDGLQCALQSGPLRLRVRLDSAGHVLAAGVAE